MASRKREHPGADVILEERPSAAFAAADPWAQYAHDAATLSYLPASPAPAAMRVPGVASQLLRTLVSAEIDAVQHTRDVRAQFLNDRTAGSLAFDAATDAALDRLRAQKETARDAAARRLRDGSAAAASGGADGCAEELDDTGGDEMDAEGGGDVDLAADDEAAFPPRYTGRPCEGYTSGALYLAAEHYCGFPPVKRTGWRDIVAETTLLSSSYLPLGGNTKSVAHSVEDARSIGALSPAIARQAAEALRQPRFPDRSYPLPVRGRGSRMARNVAIAADADAAAADDALFCDGYETALRSMLRELPLLLSPLGQSGGGRSGSAAPEAAAPAAAAVAATATPMLHDASSAAIAIDCASAAGESGPAVAPLGACGGAANSAAIAIDGSLPSVH